MKKSVFILGALFSLGLGLFLIQERIVTLGHPHRGPIVQGVYGTGLVEADGEVPLSFQKSGRLQKLWVQEGQKVKKGQLLAELDLEDDRASLKSLKASEENALQIYKRRDILFKKKTISPEQLEEARTAYDRAHFDRVAAEAKLDEGHIRAPQDGIIIRKDKQVGETLQSDEVFLWFAPEEIRITADMDEEYFPLLKQGQKAYCQAPAFPQKVFSGKIYQITPKGDTVQRTYRVRLRPEAPYPPLSLGMTVEVNVLVRQDQKALLVPKEAYMQGVLWSVHKYRLKKQPVTIGVQNETSVEILKGLKDGEYIVLSPHEDMEEGQWVWPIKP
jgi:RND family efflux transporter MFP subunit